MKSKSKLSATKWQGVQSNARAIGMALAITAFALCVMGCYSWFEDNVEMSTSVEQQSNVLGNFLTNQNIKESEVLDATQKITVSQGEYADSIKIAWTPVKNANCYDLKWMRFKKEDIAVNASEKVNFEGVNLDEPGEKQAKGDAGGWKELTVTSYTHKLLTSPKADDAAYNYVYYYQVIPINNVDTRYRAGYTDQYPNIIPEMGTRDDGTKYELPLFNGYYNGEPALWDFKKTEEGTVVSPDAKPQFDTPKGHTYTLTTGNNNGYLFAPPTTTSATNGESITLPSGAKSDVFSQIVIKWDEVPGAAYYMVYKSSDVSGSGASVIQDSNGNVQRKSTTFVDTISEENQGKTFAYMVRAVTIKGELSCLTNVAQGFAKQRGAPEPPDNIKLKNPIAEEAGGVTIQWKAVTNDDADNQTLKYHIYRRRSTDGFSSSEKIAELNDTVTEYTDGNGLKAGVIYNYLIQTIITKKADGSTLKSAFSNTANQIVDNTGKRVINPNRVVGFLLTPPTSAEAVDRGDKRIIRWMAAAGHDYLGEGSSFDYEIWAKDSADGSFSQKLATTKGTAGTTGTYTDGAKTTKFDDTGYLTYELAADGKHPFYMMRTTKGSNASENGDTFAPSPKAPTNVTASKTAKFPEYRFIDDSQAGGPNAKDHSANANEVFPVKITWKAPENEVVASYEVRRGKSRTGSFSSLAKGIGAGNPPTGPDPDWGYDDATQTYFYIDKNLTAKAGQIFYYKVFSKNMFGGGNLSNTFSDGTAADTEEDKKARGYGALTRERWFAEFNRTSNTNSHKKMKLLNAKPDTAKLGSETTMGDKMGKVTYKASLAGLGAHIVIEFIKYCDFTVKGYENEPLYYFVLSGNTNSDCNMSSNGEMSGTMVALGPTDFAGKGTVNAMYPGICGFDDLKVVGGDGGGGSYPVTTYDLEGNVVLEKADIGWNTASSR